MASIFKVNLLLNFLVSVFVFSSAQTCSNNTFSLNRVFNSCTDLPYLGAQLHWNYIPSLKKVSIAYRARQISQGWVAWAINPTGTGMVGSQALVAFRNANGSMSVYPTSITSYNPSMLPAELSFQVSNISAEYENNEITIYAVVGPLEDETAVNHVWQAGSSVSSNIPQIHSTSPPNLQSMGVQENGSVAFTVDYEFATRTKPSQDSVSRHKGNYTFSGRKTVGDADLFRVEWATFIADDRPYFIKVFSI